MLNEILRLKDLNMQVMLEAMMKGDRTAIDYAHGFEDALTNITWFIHAENQAKKEHIKNEVEE